MMEQGWSVFDLNYIFNKIKYFLEKFLRYVKMLLLAISLIIKIQDRSFIFV